MLGKEISVMEFGANASGKSNFVSNLDTIVSSTQRNTGCVCNECGISFKAIRVEVFINLE